MSDFDDLGDDLARTAVEVVPPEAFTDDLRRMLPLVQSLVQGFAAGTAHMDDLQTRGELVELRAWLVEVLAQLGLVRETIERLFLLEAQRIGAQALPLPDGREVAYEPARGEYIVQARALHDALAALLPADAVEGAFREETTIHANNTRLNALSRRYGGEVAAAIAEHRVYRQPPPERGRVRFPD